MAAWRSYPGRPLQRALVLAGTDAGGHSAVGERDGRAAARSGPGTGAPRSPGPEPVSTSTGAQNLGAKPRTSRRGSGQVGGESGPVRQRRADGRFPGGASHFHRPGSAKAKPGRSGAGRARQAGPAAGRPEARRGPSARPRRAGQPGGKSGPVIQNRST